MTCLPDHSNNPQSSRPDDSFQLGDPYEYFMGRWSRVVARDFVNWLSPAHNLSWLDIGCGTGALSEAIVDLARPARLFGLDQSEGFADSYLRRFGDSAHCFVGSAMSLPTELALLDYTVSGLVLNFLPDPATAIEEMKRVTAPGGVVALYVWDYAGSMDLLNKFWDAAVSLDPKAVTFHEARRFAATSFGSLYSLFEGCGLGQIESVSIDIPMKFSSFDDYWRPFLGGQGPAPAYLTSLGEQERERLRLRLVDSLNPQSDGSISLQARALAIRGKKQVR